MSVRPKLLIYTFDMFGMGHLMRALKIVDAFHARWPDLSTLIVSGSPAASLYERPEGVQLLEIPAVSRDKDLQRVSRDPRYSLEEARQRRAELIFAAARDFEPTLVLADNEPVGMDGEALPTLRWLKERESNPFFVLGIRDVVGTPEVIREHWQTYRAYEALEEIYDKVFVYGTPEFDDPALSYTLSARVKEKVVFTGFIPDFVASEESHEGMADDGVKRIFLTLGSGEDGEQVIVAFLDMLEGNGSELAAQSLVITGPMLPDPPMSSLKRRAEALGIVFKSFVPSIIPFLKSADLVISMGGYNTMMEILSHAKRALIIPRVWGRGDQLLRARKLHELNLLDFIPITELTTDLLFSNVQSLLASSTQPLANARETNLLPMDGAEVLARACEPLLFKRGS